VGIAGASGKQSGDEEPDKKQTNDYRAAHVFSKEGANARTITNFWTLHQGTATGSVNKVTAVTH
ncbi:MAG: hypothetical protein WBR30_22650, partial [Candidatus Sulfotelmatobacter sp.]